MDEPTRGSTAPADAARPRETDDVDLLHYVEVIRRHRWLLGGSTAAAIAVSALVSIFLPRVYEASATIMPLSRNQPRIGTLLSNLGGLADLAGMGESIPEEGSDLLVNVLGSRALAQRVIESEGLLPLLYPGRCDASTGSWSGRKPEMIEAVDLFRNEVLVVSSTGRGVITVTARMRDPAAAASVANAAVTELESFLKRHQVTTSSRTGAFLEKRRKESAGELKAAEEALRDFCQENGVISMPDQTRLLFEQISALSTQAAARRARLEVAETFGGSANPEASTLRAEIMSLEKEILNLERGVNRGEGPMVQANGFIPLYDVPEKSLLYQRLLREVKVKQEVYAFLLTELEAARIKQSREEIAFTLLDAAQPPLSPVRPRPLLIVGLSGVFTALSAFLLASFLERLQRARPISAEASSR